MTDETGSLSKSFDINILFSSSLNVDDIVLSFQEVCAEIEVRYLQKRSENSYVYVYTKKITNNDSQEVNIIVDEDKKNNKYDKLLISITKTKEPYRYVKLNEIDFGSFKMFTNDEIVDLDIIDELSIDSSELSANYLEITIDDTKKEYNILNPNNKLSYVQEKQEITVYHYLKVGESYREIPLGTFLLKEFKSGKNTLKIEAYDDTYFMNKIYYGSNYYDNVPVTIIYQDLFNYFNYTNYIIDDELKGITLTGYIPNVEFREALRIIAEASCSVINKTRYGKTYVFKTFDPSIKTFSKRLQFKENNEKNLFNNVIDITEYTYKSIENQEVYNANLEEGTHTLIFKNYPILENTLVKANQNNNYEIIQSFATTCIVNVKSQTDVILNATLMEQSGSVKRVSKEQDLEVEEFAISKVNNTLITSKNSNGVADWKLNRSNVKFNFDTLLIPYVEVGDTCIYETEFGTKNEFIPTRIEFTKSFIQNIEGE